MAKKNKLTLAAIDLGSYSIKILLGQTDSQSSRVVPITSLVLPSQGIRRGSVVEPFLFNQTIQKVLEYLKFKKIYIDNLVIGLNGDYLDGQLSLGVLRFNKTNHVIDANDLHRIKNEVQKLKLSPNRHILQSLSNSYSLDGQKNILNPLGLNALRLEMESYVVSVSTPVVAQIEKIFNNNGFRINNLSLSSFAAAQVLLSEEQKNFGTLVLDIGFQTSNLIVYADNQDRLLKIFNIGSQHITNDLAMGLKISLSAAEKLKLQFNDLGKNIQRSIFLKADDQVYKFKIEDINTIIEARLEDFIDLINDSLKTLGYNFSLPGGIILTGGGSKLTNLTEFFSLKMNLACQILKPNFQDFKMNTIVDKQDLSAVQGLLYLDKFYINEFNYFDSILNKNQPETFLQKWLKF